MSRKLTVLVHGSGFAGQEHARAFRYAGVEVVGMLSRTREVVDKVAKEMDIPYSGTDWNKALAELRPSIVSIGTPGGPHHEAVIAALQHGCHVYCDKPLAVNAGQAREMYSESVKAGVKTAFAASFRYQPHALFAKELVGEGMIGEPWEAECVSHYNLNPLIPWGWSHSVALGGGRLSNNWTHKLSIVEHVLGGHVSEVNGETRNDMRRAPVVSGVHDFRTREKLAPDRQALEDVQWKEVDSEWTYTVMARVDSPLAKSSPVSALFKHGGMQPRYLTDYVAFFGSAGAIHINGSYAQGPLYLKKRDSEWQQLAVPDRITDALPPADDDSLRNWMQLAREFVADIRGEGYCGYQTFRQGWIYQEAIDAVRRGSGWYRLPSGL